MSFAAESIPSAPLEDEDARALTRLLRRSFGKGFRLVVIEVATPRIRQRIVEWLRSEVEPLDGDVLDLDVGSLPGENLWSELGERLEGRERERIVLALHGFQEAAHGQPDERAGLYRQLNVQRDLFVRDLGGFWVVLIDPHGSRKLQDIAPDFCDFASLWIRAAPGGDGESDWRAMPRISHDVARSLELDSREQPQSELLRKASEALTAGRYTQARDLLTRFEFAADADSEDMGPALRVRGRLELLRGNLDAARRAGEEALAWSCALGQRGEAATADALHLLGSVLTAQGQYQQARGSLERSLEIKQELLGTEEHPAIAVSLHELARVHMALGHTEDARRLLERALEIHEDPLASAASLHELASVLREQGDLEGARRALEQTLEIEKQTFGTERHPSVAITLHSLALVSHAEGDLATARRLVERSLEIKAKVLETPFHPDVAASLHELASILSEQGDLDGARRNLERVLEIGAQMLGTESHPDAAATLHELAIVLRKQGDLEGARRNLERALEICLEAFGTALHPNVPPLLHSLALLLADMGEPSEAAANFERALEIATQIWGPDHQSTCMSEIGFAKFLIDMGEQERAQALLLHARPILASALGPNNRWVQQADELLAILNPG